MVQSQDRDGVAAKPSVPGRKYWDDAWAYRSMSQERRFNVLRIRVIV